MEWLGRNRRVVSLRDLYQGISAGTLEDNKAIAITFDDGFANNFHVAVPILREMGFPACFFIATDFVALAGQGTEALRQWETRVYRFTKASEPMTWEQIQALAGEGFEIGSHTVTHAKLAALRPEQIREEVLGSAALLEAELGVPPVFFAYPYGKSAMAPPASRPAVMQSGKFLAAFSTERGWNTVQTHREWWRRDSMEPSLSPRVLEAFLSGVFDKD